MRTLYTSGQPAIRRGAVLAAVIAVATVSATRAHAADPAEVTISTPMVKTIGYYRDQTPIDKVAITARLSFDPATLSTKAGVTTLKDRVLQAAHYVCITADPEDLEDDEHCILQAIREANAKIDSAAARLKHSKAGS